MDDRRDLEKELYRLYALSRIKNMTEQNRADILRKIDKIEDMLEDDYEEVLDIDEMDVRREVLKDNSGLNDIFSAIWFCCSEYVTGGILRVQGFVKFYLLISKALGSFYDGEEGDKRLIEKALSEYVRNVKLYNSEMSRGVFNDILFKIIELHTEFVDPMYYSAFSWSLLDAVTDLSRQPPAFRPIRKVKAFIMGDNEAVLLSNYLNADAQKKVTNLKVANEWMDRVPDVMQRVGSRRKGKELTETDIQLVAILANKLKKQRQKENGNKESGDYSDTDSEENDEHDDHKQSGQKEDEKKSHLEKVYDSVFKGKHEFDLNGFKNRRRELRKLGIGRSDWLDHQKDPNMPILEIGGVSDGMADSLKKSKFGTWVAGSTLKRETKEDLYDIEPGGEKSKKKVEKPKGKTFSAGGKATHSWDEKMVYLQHKNKLKKKIKITRTRVLTPQTPVSPMRKEGEAKNDILNQTVDADVKEMFSPDEGTSAAISEPIEEGEGEFDTEEWATFRLSLQEMKKTDVETKKRVEEERVRIEAEIERRKEDMRREMDAYRVAREREEQEKKDKVVEEEKQEQAYVDGLLSTVDHESEIAAHPSDSIKRVQHPHPDPNEDYLPGPVEFKLESPTPMLLAQHAIDDASEFNPTFDEQYELDSFFSASGPASVGTSLKSDELAAAMISAANTASEKKKRREEKMAKIVFEDEERRGKWKFTSSKVRHLRDEDCASQTSMASSSITIAIPSAEAADDSDGMKTDSQLLTLTTMEAPMSPNLKRIDSVTTDLSVAEVSQASIGSEYGSIGRNYADVYPLDKEGEHEFETPKDHIDQPTPKDKPLAFTEIEAHAIREESKSLMLSYDSQIDGRKRQPSASFFDGDADTVRPNPNPTVLERSNTNTLPFPHKSFSNVVQAKLGGTGRDGNLGSWNHERAATMQLRTKKPLGNEKDLLRTDTQLNTVSKSLEALRIQKRELPWFQRDSPPRIRGLAYNPNDPTKAPAPQRPVIRPENRLMGSSGDLLLKAKHGNSLGVDVADGDAGGGMGVSVPQASMVSLDSGVVSTSEVSAQLGDMKSSRSLADSIGSIQGYLEGPKRTLLQLNSLSPTQTEAELTGESAGLPKRAILAPTDTDMENADTLQAPRSPSLAEMTSNREPVMTGVEPPMSADGQDWTNQSFGMALPSDNSLSMRALQFNHVISPSRPYSGVTSPLGYDTDPLSVHKRNHTVKSIVSSSEQLLLTDPSISPVTKNPAKPKNLIDGPIQNVARGFLKEPEPLPSPNRSKPLKAPQGNTLLVRTASLSSRDWLLHDKEKADSIAGKVEISHAKDEGDLKASTLVVDTKLEDAGSMARVDGEDFPNLGGDEATVVSFLTAEEPLDDSLSPHLHQSLVNDSLEEMSKSVSGLVNAAEEVNFPEHHDAQMASSLRNDAPSHEDQSSAPKKNGTSLMIKSCRSMPAILTDEAVIMPNAFNVAAKKELEVKNHLFKAIMTDTLTSEASAAQIVRTDNNLEGDIMPPSGSLLSSLGTKGSIVVTVERHYDALAPPSYDAVGPASAMGLKTIENHPRFKYTSLPAPTQEPVLHFAKNKVSSRAPDRVINVRQERVEGWAHDKLRKMSKGDSDCDDNDEDSILLHKMEQTLKSAGLGLRDSRELAKSLIEHPVPFWLPKNLKQADSVIAHDRSNHINGWNDVKVLLRGGYTETSASSDRAVTLMTIKRQEAFLERFKDYSALASIRDSNLEWSRFKNRNEELLPVGTKKPLGAFKDRFIGKKLKPKPGKFMPLRKKIREDKVM